MMHHGMWGMGPGAMIVFAILVIVPVWRICTKAGFSGWLALLSVVPIANLLLLYFLAFAQWPIERRLSAEPGRRVAS